MFSSSGYLTSPKAISAAANYTDGGYQIAKSIFNRIGGQGNVLLVTGIPGLASSDSFDNGVTKALKETPGIKLVGTVAGKGRTRWRKSRCRNSSPRILNRSMRLSSVAGRDRRPEGAPAVRTANRAHHASRRSRNAVLLEGPSGMDEGRLLHVASRRRIRIRLQRTDSYAGGPRGKRCSPSCVTRCRSRWLTSAPRSLRIAAPIRPTGSSRTRDKWFPESLANQFFLHPHDPLTWKS